MPPLQSQQPNFNHNSEARKIIEFSFEVKQEVVEKQDPDVRDLAKQYEHVYELHSYQAKGNNEEIIHENGQKTYSRNVTIKSVHFIFEISDVEG